MDENDAVFDLLIGTGGMRPSLWVLPSNGDPATALLDLPRGHSVYAFDLDMEEKQIAAGDRAGNISILSWSDSSTAMEASRIQTLTQGAPVLSVCLAGHSKLAATDTTGRCLLWHSLDAAELPRELETGGEYICSLLRLDADTMAGLSATGKLRIWDTVHERCLHTLAGSSPPDKLAQVRLIHWPARNAILYPTVDGDLAVCELGNPAVEAFHAHQGEFYVCVVDGDQLHTLGKNDGLLKTWGEPGRQVAEPCGAPRGIVSGDIRMNRPGEFLLIHENGKAATFTIDSRALRLVHRLPGNHFRTVGGPSPTVRQNLENLRRLTACRQLRELILEEIDSGQTEAIEALHEEMITLGFESVSLALRAHQAVLEEDIIGELRVRQKLSKIMPEQGSKYLHRYATLLVQTWQLAEARVVFDKIPDAEVVAPEWLPSVAKVLAEEKWIIEPNLSIPVLIEAATILNHAFTGRWVVHLSPSTLFPEGTLTADTLASKYEQEKNDLMSLPKAHAHSFWWCSESSVREVEAVVFTPPSNHPGAGLKWMIQILNTGVQSSFRPVVLFDAGPRRPDRCPEDHNQWVLSAWEKISLEEGYCVWPRALEKTVSLALRRLHTRARYLWTARK